MKRSLLLIAGFCVVSAVCSQELKDTITAARPVLKDTVPYATLYVYRQAHKGLSNPSYDLHIGDSVICRVRNDSKYVIRIYHEGKTVFWAKTEKKVTKEIDIKYGMAYYLKCDVSTSGVFVMRPTLQLIYAEYGKFDFKGVEGKNSETNRDN